jgi:hypothetical protein
MAHGPAEHPQPVDQQALVRVAAVPADPCRALAQRTALPHQERRVL